MKKKKSKWERLIKYINDQEIGTVITRGELKKYYNPKNSKFIKYSTIDNYRRLLTRAGVLEIQKAGQYKILKHVKKDVTCGQFIRVVTEQPWIMLHTLIE